MFILKLYDRNGKPLEIGDIVKISDCSRFQFYAEVKYLEKEQAITPFHTFSFHSFEKVDSVPENAVECNEERYRIWHVPNPQLDPKEVAEQAEKYLIDWRQCEHLLQKKCYRITPFNPS